MRETVATRSLPRDRCDALTSPRPLRRAHFPETTLTEAGAVTQVSWQSVFYFWGFFGFCWTALWITFSASRPTEHPFISQEEVAYISYHVQSKVWACIAGHTAFNWVIYMLLTELPSFMKVVLGMELAASGRLSGLPFLTLFVTQTAAGMAADWLVKKGHARVGHLLPSDVWLV
eukprot:gene10626-12567_t